jgi:hypothetical protein
MTLNEIDRHSALWQKIDKEITERLDVLRQRNDGDLNEVETATLRGTIKAFKEIQQWGRPDPDIG